MKDIALLVIDFPDERLGHRRQFDHMHAWGTADEMRTMKRLLEDQLGASYRHMIVDGYVCPNCGATPPDRKTRGNQHVG